MYLVKAKIKVAGEVKIIEFQHEKGSYKELSPVLKEKYGENIMIYRINSSKIRSIKTVECQYQVIFRKEKNLFYDGEHIYKDKHKSKHGMGRKATHCRRYGGKVLSWILYN